VNGTFPFLEGLSPGRSPVTQKLSQNKEEDGSQLTVARISKKNQGKRYSDPKARNG
jgi:hypothetical protein